MQTLTGDIADKKTRLEKVKNDIKSSNYEGRLAEKLVKARDMDEQREKLTTEMGKLSSQADARARLDLKRTEIKNKTADVKNTCGHCVFMLSISHLIYLTVSRQLTTSSVSWSGRMHMQILWSVRLIVCQGMFVLDHRS